VGLYIYTRAKTTRNWPSVTGKILKTVESYTEEYDPNETAMRSGNFNYVRRKKVRFSGVRSALQYAYVVSEKKYIGNSLYSAEALQFKTPILADITVGDLVKVFYNPRKPHDSFLAHSFAGKTIFLIIIGIVITFIPLLTEAITKLSS